MSFAASAVTQVAGHFGAVANAARERTGSLPSGEQVQVKDAQSILSDAREEMTFVMASRIETRSMGQRQIGGAGGARRLRAEQINDYLKATHLLQDSDDRAEVLRRMQTSRRPRDAAARESRTPAHQFVLLQMALDDAVGRDMPAAVQLALQDALDELDQLAGSQIQAGLNSAQSAAGFEPTAQGVQNFQQAYADIVLGEPTFAQTFEVVLQRLSGARGDDFERGLQALLHALGADLSATQSSCDPRRLNALVKDVHEMQIASTVLLDCRNLSQDVIQRLGIPLDPLELMKVLVSLTSERWVQPGRLVEMAARFRVAGLPERLWFHRCTRKVLRDMPVRVFPDAEARNNILGSAQSAYDETVAEEEKRRGE